ncbi:type II toxin-antitoxin system HipA family toxin [Taklimakanibacter deserti]|uniref:type II toxin-antitoxin system HipA family toxin n=1 Tax=Taklimakanibacter deserti TaxID=2267839 RepID=UPI000E647066
MPDLTVLDVLLHGRPIGTLTRTAGDRTLLAFNQAYLTDSDRPTLGLAFKDTLGGLITDFKPTQTRLLPFFSNLLPEGPLRAYLAAKADVNPQREFFLSWALGEDLPGAVTIQPPDNMPWLVDPDQAPDKGHRHEDALRFSLAGVQLKFSAVAEARGGLTIPAKGIGGSWIVKLPSREFEGVPENEYSMMTLARLVGMNIPPLKLIQPDEIENLPRDIGALRGMALAIERFDRTPASMAVHIEDFAQVFGIYPEDKYKRASYRNIAQVIGAEGSQDDMVEFTRRLVFNVLIGNADMHLKNWSMIYPDRRKARLSPAYDFVSTISYLPDAKAALTFSRTKRFDEFTEDELSHLAIKALLPEKLILDTARETVSRFHQHWQAERSHLPLPASTVQAIEGHFEGVPLARL